MVDVHAIYNEIEPYAAEWLQNLIAQGNIANGRVDTRSVADLLPDDVAGAGQRHFFAGIGVWSLALRLAGWPDDLAVWTGSCPCQPFSQAGRGRGFADDRHLWPEWFRLIEECRPAVVLGEQVASKDGLAWFDAVRADLERSGYAVGVADLCAAGVGAPHIRQRLYWVADAMRARRERSSHEASAAGRLRSQPWASGIVRACADGTRRRVEPGIVLVAHGHPARDSKLRAIGNAIVPQVAAEFVAAYLDCG